MKKNYKDCYRIAFAVLSWPEDVFVGLPLAKTKLSGEQIQRTLPIGIST